MANWYEPTDEQCAEWDAWVETRPAVIQQMAARLKPWLLFRMKSTGQRVYPYSFNEEGTCTVVLSGRFNLVMIESKVFGIDPDDLEECELPGPDDRVGILLSSPAERLAYINRRRAENGLPPLDEEPTP